MPCYKPLHAFHGPEGITFSRNKSFGIPIELPCGRCIGCRLEKAKEWAIRCIHEAQMHEDNIFITLTYASEHLPKNYSLDHEHFQIFIRALRDKTKKKLRFYMCGEYGEPTEENNFIARPHFHAIIFGHDFEDKTYWKTRNGNRVYRSETLESIWTKGNSEIGTVTFESAGYVARYVLKKQTGERAEAHYNGRKPEYTRMSNRKGIGESWYQKYKNEVFPDDFVVTPDGRKMQTPTYYRRLLEREDPELHEQLKKLRVVKAQTNPNNTPERLIVREKCHKRKAERLKRTLQ